MRNVARMALKTILRRSVEAKFGVWREIPEFPDYEVSSRGGYVRNRATGLVLADRTCGNGRLKAALIQNNKPCYPYIHDLVLGAFRGPKPKGWQGHHGPKGWSCNDLTNLTYISRADHDLLSAAKRKQVPAGKHAMTASLVRHLGINEGVKQAEIARFLNVPGARVRDILNGTYYRRVESLPDRDVVYELYRLGWQCRTALARSH